MDLLSSAILAELVETVGLFATVVVTFTLISGRVTRWPELAQQVLLGVVFGATAIVGMNFPIYVSSGIFIDGRAVMLGLAGPFGGPLTGIVASVLGAGYRLSVGGIGAPAGALNCALAGLAGIGLSVWLTRSGRRLHHRHLLILGLLVSAGVLASSILLPTGAALEVVSEAGLPLTIVTVGGVLLLGSLLLQERRRHETEITLAEAERRFSAIVSNMPGVVYQRLRTPDGDIRFPYLSPQAADLLGVDIDVAVANGTVLLDKIHADDLERILRSHRISAEGLTSWNEDFRVVLRNGAIRWIRGTSTPHRRPDGSVLWDGFLLDITDRKRAEQDILAAKQGAEAASRTKSEFLANMSHEFRTPLNAVIGFSDIIKSELFGPLGHPRYREYASDIQASGQHLLDLVNDLLDLSKVEAGQMALHDEMVTISDLIQASVRMLEPRAARSGVTLKMALDPRLSVVRGDEQRLKQILLNLLSNAIKYTPEGGRAVVSATLDNAGRPLLLVEDTGIGIAEADLPRVMEPFGQASNVMNRTTTGTGLGLPLTRRLVEMHGGTLTLRSRVGIGTTVTVTLPLERAIRQAA